jgi:hypothetical protein
MASGVGVGLRRGGGFEIPVSKILNVLKITSHPLPPD